MNPHQDPLWDRLLAFNFDNTGDALTFTQRLARENGWSLGFAQRVVEEYRRFLYLALRASHSVTPSDAVDKPGTCTSSTAALTGTNCALTFSSTRCTTARPAAVAPKTTDSWMPMRPPATATGGVSDRNHRATSGPSRQCASLRRHAGSGWIWPPTGASPSLPCDGRVSVCWGSSGFPVRPSAAHGSTAKN